MPLGRKKSSSNTTKPGGGGSQPTMGIDQATDKDLAISLISYIEMKVMSGMFGVCRKNMEVNSKKRELML